MTTDFSFYILILVAIVAGIVVIKKVTGCIFRLVTLLIIIGILAFVYFTYFR